MESARKHLNANLTMFTKLKAWEQQRPIEFLAKIEHGQTAPNFA